MSNTSTSTQTVLASDITNETSEFMATKEYQDQLALTCDEEARGYDDSCPNEENEEEA